MLFLLPDTEHGVFKIIGRLYCYPCFIQNSLRQAFSVTEENNVYKLVKLVYVKPLGTDKHMPPVQFKDSAIF